MSTGGSIIGVGIDGRNFSATADADASRKLGGMSNAVEMNGDGSKRDIKTRMAWELSGVVIACDDLLDDQEFIQDLADSSADFDIEIEYISGAVYGGRGQVTEDVAFSNASSTVTVTFSGGGKLTRQA